MKLLHTSDWHLGRTLYLRKRHTEHQAFLDWLLQCIEQQGVDVLIIAGDVFDTTTPSHQAQNLYYRFLAALQHTSCQHVVIVAGNHDSPSLLEAPRGLLKALNIHIIGAVEQDISREVLLLQNQQQQSMAYVCAVPYLRDRDIRTVAPGESLQDKGAKMVEGVQQHYQQVCELAQQQRDEADIPLIATGHLFASGGQLEEGDGVRDLHVGSLGHVRREVFPASIDYLALGHLHVPQVVGGQAHLRYSGSPIPMGFGEARQQKSVALVAFTGKQPHVELLPVPCFQRLQSLKGDLVSLEQQITLLKAEQQSIWLDVQYNGQELVGNLRDTLDQWIDGSDLEVLRIRNVNQYTPLSAMQAEEVLNDLKPQEVFQRRLASLAIDEAEQAAMLDLHEQLLQELLEEQGEGLA